MPINWFRGAPDAYARAEQELREMYATRELAGTAGGILRALRQDRTREDEENAEIEALRARLGLQAEQANAETGTLTEESLATGARTSSVTPWAEADEPAEAAEEPGGATSRLAQMALGYGVDLGRRALVGTGLRPNVERQGRLGQLGRLTGQVERRRDELAIAGQLSPLARLTRDPGAFYGKVAPSLGLRAGDVQIDPTLSRTGGRGPTLIDLAIAAEQGVPGAAAALERAVAAQARIRGAGRVGGGGAGGYGTSLDRQELAIMLADMIRSGRVEEAQEIAKQYELLGGLDAFDEAMAEIARGLTGRPGAAAGGAVPPVAEADPEAQAAVEEWNRGLEGAPLMPGHPGAARRPPRMVEGFSLDR